MIEVVGSFDPRVQRLEEELQLGYEKSYGQPDPNPEGGIEGCDMPYGFVLLDTEKGRSRGMIATRLVNGRALSGRLYVEPRFRRQGVARGLLLYQEGFLMGRGIREIWMETEDTNRPIIALRTSMGFKPIAPYGYYTDNETSVFYGKTLRSQMIMNEGCER
ncbi:N-acyltransferase [Microbacterium phage Hendrix]|uniref:Acetyltransferase n=1 Tax=Microbacterium phage Hendrix TaxID=2182341 RepID=A0A2U8UUH5_9CAUD|nr:N-acyltransferase [Microbacterium phage Hendrix]AWN07824.1 acetyltransferase [Microbacterium phage Hendrix]